MIIPATPHNNKILRPTLSMSQIATKVNSVLTEPSITVCNKADSAPAPAVLNISGNITEILENSGC